MSTSYTFLVRIGYRVSADDVKKPFEKKIVTHEDGIFHMEDRYDPKTGAKLEPVKVWDKREKNKTERWWEIDGERIDDWEDEPMGRLFAEKLGCEVENYWQAYGDDWGYGFYPHEHGEVVGESHNTNIYVPSLTYQQIKELEPKLAEIKQKLEAMGIKVGEPELFLGEVSG